jgi:type I protein arginine methyltransferase
MSEEEKVVDETESKSSPASSSGDSGEKESSSDYYWNSYAHFGIHEEMLKDEVRTKSYRAAITENKHLFKDKIVLDVGCGTGILSMFAAQAGAKHVYAVDMSDIIKQAEKIIEANGFASTVTCIQGKVEELELPVEKVDVIVSEWMGYFLVYENMLKTVLIARDRWLADDGIMMPDKATMYLCGIEDGHYKEDKIHWWENVYGFDMSCIRDLAMKEPVVDVVEGDAANTTSCALIDFDISKMNVEDLDFVVQFKLVAQRDDYIHALVAYFDIEFSHCHKPVRFSTGPFTEYTHWKQTVFYLEEVLLVSNGDEITGSMHVRPNAKNPRDMDIELKYDFTGKYGKIQAEQQYCLR